MQIKLIIVTTIYKLKIMAHFTVMVIGDNPEEQLSPFNEHLEVARYVKYTPQQLIKMNRKGMEEFKNGTYAEYFADPEKFEQKHGSSAEYIDYLKYTFMKMYNRSDDEIHKDEMERCDEDDLGANGEIYSTYNPLSKWDWYELGGRWTGFLKIKEGCNATVGERGLNAIVGGQDIFVPPAKPGFTDAALKQDIDLEFMENADAEMAAKAYGEAMSILGHLPINKPLESFDGNKDEWNNQERCIAWKLAKQKDFDNWKFDNSTGPDDFLIDREEYLQNARNGVLSTYAILKDGEWYEKGSMGMFRPIGIQICQSDWDKEILELFNELPGDTLISIYDCHI